MSTLKESKESVDPTNIPKRLTQPQKEWFILFSIAVAGKSARQTEKKLNDFLESITPPGWAFAGPFAKISYLVLTGKLDERVKEFKFGQYNRIVKAFTQVSLLRPDTYTIEKLEAVEGIGPKTARFIYLYTSPKADCVPLDTHILKYLREQGIEKVPTSTPQSGPTYARLEREFQTIAAKQNKSVRQLDTEVWNHYASKHAI